MSYLSTVDTIRAVAESLNPNGVFVHGRTWDASLEFNSPNCHIYLYPMTGLANLSNHYYERYDVVLGFFFQDAPDSSNDDREWTIAAADILARTFINNLNESDGIEISEAKFEPQFRKMAGTYTGYLLRFTFAGVEDLCATDAYILNTDNTILRNTDGQGIRNT